MLKYLFALLLAAGVLLYSQEFQKVEGTEEEEFIPYEGEIIRNINYRILDVSGTSLKDSNGVDSSWFTQFANSMHYKTREWVVKNYLLFSEGDILDAYEISESERILRESDFFLDSRIIVRPTEHKDSVDVTVITKDRWTLILQLSLNAQKNSYAGLRDDNLLGLGHKLDGTITHDGNPMIGWGYNLKYTAHNVAGSWIDASAGIETNKKNSIKNLDLARSFVSISTRWAGGLSLQWANNNLFVVNRDGYYMIPYENKSIDTWAGYALPVPFGNQVFRKRSSIAVAGRVNKSVFSKRPYVSPDSNRVFTNNTLYLASTGFINRRYYRDHYINRFGPTEDVAVGGMLIFTGGYDVSEFSKRFYSGFDGVYSRRLNNIGYISLHAAAGGFFNNRRWEQNAYLFDLLYHSRLIRLNGWTMRVFTQHQYLVGNNRYEQEQVFLDTENGLRGHERFQLHGISKGLLKLEARIFTPFEPLGFAIGVKLFSDLGIIADKGEDLFNSRVYQSYGAGLRISNESISRAHFDVAVAYRPYTPANHNGSFAILFTSSLVLGHRSFNFSKPTTINYGEN
jgi:hypothetical protein